MEHIFLSLVGVAFILFGLSVFKTIGNLTLITTPLWNLLENRLKGKGANLSDSKRKLFAVFSIIIGFVLIIGSINAYIDQLKWEQKQAHIVSEAERLGISVEEYRTIDSALFYMPPNSTVEDYKKIDEKAKKSGFTDGFAYLLEEQSAKKDGKTIDQVIAERAKRKAEEVAERKAEEEKEQQAKAYAQSSNQSSGGGDKSRVVSIVGWTVYLANGDKFILEKPTVLHLDGQIYPKADIAFIQVGYRCRYTGDLVAIEAFCER
jgi:hypothetical protein